MLVVAVGVLAGHPAETLAGPKFHHAADTNSTHSGSDSTRNLVVALAVFVLGAVGLVAARRRWRQQALLALVGLLCVFAAETALHSAHHFGDPHAVQTCAVLASSTHVDGVCGDVPGVADPLWLGYTPRVVDTPVFSLQPWFRLDKGRAPPAARAS
jgi:hypothetical protein